MDLLNQINETKNKQTVATEEVEISTSKVEEVKPAETSTVETKPTETSTNTANTDRSPESLYDEIRELRAENKARRLQLQEETSKIEEKFQSKLQSYEDQMKKALTAKEELETLKAKEADKKRSIEEKLAHRESTLAQIEAEKKSIQEQLQAEIAKRDAELEDLRVAQEAQKQVYLERIKEEIAKVPETKRKFAEMIIKGYSDPREGWAALSEAKADGLFEDKVVAVSHATPGANVSRMTTERQEAIKNAESSKLNARQKISLGLKQVSNVKEGIL